MERVNQDIYREWILSQDLNNEFTIEYDEVKKVIHIKSSVAEGRISFTMMNVVELEVDNLITSDSLFYLHFQLNTLSHACDLFFEMIDCMKSVKVTEIHQILLACSSGFTTSFFAEKLNEAFELLNLNYHIDALSFGEIEETSDQYELVCIAPQIAYMLDELQVKLPHANIVRIPSQIFATYDAGEMIKFIQQYIEKPVTEEIIRPNSYRELQKHEETILCLNIIRNSRRTHIAYAVYDRNNVALMNDTVIKPRIYIYDIYDAIDICLLAHPEIKCIGLSLPGIINKRHFISANYVYGLNNHNLDNLFTNKYDIPFVFTNDANAAAVGWYSTQENYESISFIYQPLYYRSGIGTVLDGKLLVGAHNLSGEVKLLPIGYSKQFGELIKEKDGGIEIISKQMLALITTIDPEAIVLCSQLINDIDLLKEELLRHLGRKEYMPVIIKERSFHPYVFLGQLILCIESLDNKA